MGERLELKKSLIEPVYPQTEPNQPIDLGTVAVQFAHEGKTYQEMAQVTMRFMPADRLLFVIPAKNDSPQNAKHQPMMANQIKALFFAFDLDDKWDGKLELTDKGVTLNVFERGSGGDFGTVAFVPRTSVVNVTPKSDAISTATFHLFNFPKFYGPEDYTITSGEPPQQGRKCCGRILLKADGWITTIAAMDKTDDLCKALDHQGGFVLTHMGKIEREDGSAFSSDQLDDLLHCMHCFLSFALGRWTGLAFPIGFDQAGNRVFEQWGLPLTAPGPWNGTCSWFDALHAEFLSETFPGFMALWKDDKWHSTLWKAVYWYLVANGRSGGVSHIDAGIILAQTALELLAWTYCVEQRKMVSAGAFEKALPAADKVRLLASGLEIPLELSAHLSTLQSALLAQTGSKWHDAMDAITQIRNGLVHPRVKTQLADGSYCEVWKLSMWYLDMVLLRLCGHTGKYANRLDTRRWVGQVESVPWAKKESGKAGE